MGGPTSAAATHAHSCLSQVLLAILPGWLSGEGDVLRSLGRLGYKLGYEQQPKREVNFGVATLAVDLRDGLRLCKLADILQCKWAGALVVNGFHWLLRCYSTCNSIL